MVKSEKVGDGEGKIVSTYKEGAGFDASWTVVHAASVEDWFSITNDPRFRELLDLQKKIAGYFRGGATAAPTQRAGQPAGAMQAPADAGDPPGPGWVYKTGSKNGKVWKAWMPPQGSNESPKWL